MAVNVRMASIDDLRSIQEMNKSLFEWDRERDPGMNFDWPFQDVGETYFRRRIQTSGACFVAICDEQIAGYLAGDLRADEKWRTTVRSEVENMFVRPEFRNMGAGSALMDSFLAWSKDQGASQVLVEAFYGNDSAVAFYEKSGFKHLAVSLQANL